MVDSGSYELTTLPNTSSLALGWQSCEDTLSVVPIQDSVHVVDFFSQPSAICPKMEVDVSTAFLLRCGFLSSRYAVSYCNQGSQIADSTLVTVEIDSFLNVLGSSLPWTSQTGNVYDFEIGSVNPGECGNIFIDVEVDCGTTTLGQVHCTRATVLPDTICGLNQPFFDVESSCVIDTVVFTVQNIGTSMSLSLIHI